MGTPKQKFFHPLPRATTYKEEWIISCPAICADSDKEDAGTLLITEDALVCSGCGGIATRRMSFVWRGTKRHDLLNMGYGASVKHYYTSCNDCGSHMVS